MGIQKNDEDQKGIVGRASKSSCCMTQGKGPKKRRRNRSYIRKVPQQCDDQAEKSLRGKRRAVDQDKRAKKQDCLLKSLLSPPDEANIDDPVQGPTSHDSNIVESLKRSPNFFPSPTEITPGNQLPCVNHRCDVAPHAVPPCSTGSCHHVCAYCGCQWVNATYADGQGYSPYPMISIAPSNLQTYPNEIPVLFYGDNGQCPSVGDGPYIPVTRVSAVTERDGCMASDVTVVAVPEGPRTFTTL